MSLEELMNVKVMRSNITRKSCAKTWALILLKIVSMDKNLDRLKTPIKIGVNSNNLFKTLKALEKKIKINGKPFTTHKISSLKTAAQYKILYIGKNWGQKRCSDIETLAEKGCFIFCSNEKNVLFGPAAVLFKTIHKYPHVAINLNNAEEQGAEFQPEDLGCIATIQKD